MSKEACAKALSAFEEVHDIDINDHGIQFKFGDKDKKWMVDNSTVDKVAEDVQIFIDHMRESALEEEEVVDGK